MNLWLLEHSFFETYQAQFNAISRMNLDLFAQSFMAKNPFESSSSQKEKKYQVEQDGTAKLNISGVLKNSRSFWDALLGSKTSLTYDEMIEAINEIDSDPTVKKVDFYFETPGGEVLGIDNVAVAMSMLSKPTTAYVKNMCASGGIYLASQCDKIVAMSEASVIGSIGVMQRMYVDPSIMSITSSNAPKKAPDPSTVKGKNMIVEELDEMEALMIQRIAEGRKKTTDYVKENFGQGGVMLAKKALEVGLIDRVETQKVKMTYLPPTVDPSQKEFVPTQSIKAEQTEQNDSKIKTEYSPNKGQNKEKKRMDIQTLKNENPELFAQVIKLGEESERKRVAQFNAYKVADPQNEKLVALVDQYVAEGKQLEEVLPSLQVAIRDFKGVSAGNAPSVSSVPADPIADASKLEPKEDEESKLEVKSTVEKYRNAGLFKR